MTTTPPNSTDQLTASVRFRFIVLSLGLPIIASLVLIGLTLLWQPRLPDPVAIHWSGNTPDNFGNVWLLILPIVLMLIGLGVFTYLAARPRAPFGLLAASARILVAINVWVVVLMSTSVALSFYLQLDLLNAQDAVVGNTIGLGLLVAAVGGLALGALGWFAIPKSSVIATTAAVTPQGLDIHPDTTVTLIETLRSPTWIKVLIAFTAISTTVIIWFASGILWLTVLTGLLLSALLMFFDWKVVINQSGVRTTSVAGLLTKKFPLETISRASISQVDPMGEFGGWGYRTGFDGRYGIVVKKGPALHLEQDGKRTFVVTMENAEQAAQLINGLIQRREHPDA